MKRKYEIPVISVIKFLAKDMLTDSGLGANPTGGDPNTTNPIDFGETWGIGGNG